MTSRTCTILFTDLVGSTELRTQLGDDAFDARRRGHDRLVADAVARHGGELVKHEGDGVMTVFSSAADALSFGVAVQQAMEREHGRDEAPFVVRIGVSAGDVVEEDGDYHGTPVVEAARLCNTAEGTQVLLTDVVRALAGSRGGHQMVPAGELDLKGLADPVVAWELMWARPDSGVEIPLRLKEIVARGACVGREHELEEVTTAWKRAVAGERRLVLVAGEPGIGKTRLAGELAKRVVDHGGIALYGWCDEDLGSPYQPWVQALGAYVRTRTEGELEALAGRGLGELARLIPDVAARVPGAEPSPSVDAEAERARMFDALDAFLERASSEQPLLFVLDDIHWSDHPTLVLLRRLVRSDRPGSVLVVGTYRDTDVDRRHPLAAVLADLRREPRVTRVALGGLDQDSLGDMLADRAGHDAPPAFVQVLHDETEGNPFFVEEVVAHLVETGVIYQQDGVWTSDLAAEDLGLPEGVRDVVGRRLSMLPDTANELLTVAAIIGREFDVGTVVAASGAARDAALDALDAALRAGLIAEVSGVAGHFSFSHALVRQTLIEEIGGPRRARLHWRVGEALARSSDSPLSAVAFHLCEGVLAGDPTRAAEAADVAAEHAASVAAPEEARTLARRALDVLDDAGADDAQLRCRALLVLGETAAWESQDLAEGRENVRAAADLAQRNRWPDLASRAAVVASMLQTPGETDRGRAAMAVAALELGADAAWQPALKAMVGMARIAEGDWDEGTVILDEAVAAAIATGAPVARVFAFVGRAQADVGSPDLGRYSETVDRLEAAAEETGSAYWVIGARLHRATIALRAGDRVALERKRSELVPLAANNLTNPNVQMLGGTTALLDGRFVDAEGIAAEVLAHTDPISVNYLNASAQIAAAWYWSGRDDELVSTLEVFPVELQPQRVLLDLVKASTLARRGERDSAFDAIAADGFAAIPWDWPRPGCLCHAGSAAAWLGDTDAARALEPLLAPYAGQFLTTPVACLAFESADSVRGMLLMTLGRVDEALECFEAAAVLCDRASDAPHGVMNAHRLAGALLARDEPGDRDRACRLATDARTRAEELGMAPDVRFATAVLDAV